MIDLISRHEHTLDHLLKTVAHNGFATIERWSLWKNCTGKKSSASRSGAICSCASKRYSSRWVGGATINLASCCTAAAKPSC